jgi:hypothetical protein
VYKNTLDITSVDQVQGAALPRLQVYPNPAASIVTIRCAAAPPGVYILKIFSSPGTLVTESTHLLTENLPIQVILPPSINGLYFCRLEDAKGNMIGTSQLLVIR